MPATLQSLRKVLLAARRWPCVCVTHSCSQQSQKAQLCTRLVPTKTRCQIEIWLSSRTVLSTRWICGLRTRCTCQLAPGCRTLHRLQPQSLPARRVKITITGRREIPFESRIPLCLCLDCSSGRSEGFWFVGTTQHAL